MELVINSPLSELSLSFRGWTSTTSDDISDKLASDEDDEHPDDSHGGDDDHPALWPGSLQPVMRVQPVEPGSATADTVLYLVKLCWLDPP